MKNKNIISVDFKRDNAKETEENVIKTLPRMVSIKEMASMTGLSYTYLRHLCLEGQIVHVRAGKKYLINYDKFVDYLNGVGA